MIAQWDETVAQGERVTRDIWFEDESGSILPLDGVALGAQVRLVADGDVIATWAFSDPVDDVVVASLDESATLDIPPGVYHLDLWRRTDADGPQRIAGGTLTVEARYTHMEDL
ncbi:MAG TPA: hypothetical protein VHI13_18975 [Candidatus Kapabacteria bacterium]|nr:hypothetical protein [Candidatus Kapabacteria bacterium]